MRLTLLFFALTALSSPLWARADAPPESPAAGAPHAHEAAKTPSEETPVDYFWRKSDEAFHAGDYPRAIGLHRAIVALAPDDVESYSVAAWLLWSLGKPTEAAQFIEDGLKANPNDPEMWDAAGQHYDLQKRFADSAAAFGKAVELSGKTADMMLRRRYAHASEHAGNLAQSLEVWRGLVADFPADSVNKNNLARVERARADAQNGKTGAVAAVEGVALRGVLMVWHGGKELVPKCL